jgi:hydroxymethylpyrimidine pyrophosphatase-like HAD family hydrolase
MELLMDAFPGQIEYHSPWNVDRQATNVLRGRVDMTRAAELLSTVKPNITLIENGVIHPSAHTLIESSEPIRAYHLVPTGASKGAAIRADLKRRGLKREEALMIGDGLADLECVHEVAATFMVRNFLKGPGAEKLAAQHENVYLMQGMQGDGWSQLVRAILAAI